MCKRLILFCVFALGVCLVMWTCSKKSNPTGTGDGGGGGNTASAYTMSRDTIIVSHPAYTSWTCNGTDRVIDTTITAFMDTSVITFSSTGDTMTVVKINGDTDVVLIRVGTGSGIQGQWQGLVQSSLEATMQIASSTITTSVCMADAYMAFEAWFDTMSYNITDVKQSCNSVTLTGNTSHEVVTISFGQIHNLDIGNADMTYTSSNSQHTAFTIYANPTTCPNDYADWITSFYDANPHAAAKMAVSSSSATSTELQKRIKLLKKKLRIF